MSARIFASESTYKFAVNKSERHWVRLHFYPSTYGDHAPNNSYFAVSTSDGVTLLKNFSAYITAKALTQAYILKEFSIPPASDGSTWYDDSPYIYGAGFGVTSSASGKLEIKYPKETAEYLAPADVYSTARSMGPDPKVNMNFNLTWIFQVDGNFTYLVRLHFCELQMKKINQRVFDIFINNQTAQAQADVIAWTSAKAVPTYKDYAAYVTDGAGPNSEPSALLAEAELSTEQPSFASESSRKVHMIGGAAGGVAAASVALAICAVAYRRKKGMTGDEFGGGGAGWLPLYGGNSRTSAGNSTISGKSCASSHLANLAAICRHFSFAEIKKATKNFDESLVIGVGGFGKVYKGTVDGGTKVAIKRSNPSSEQGVNEFQTEIEMLSKLRHRHLVSLIGFCEENGAKYTIIHRDVKTTNILLDEHWVAKVSDFGLSKTGPMVNQSHVSTMVKGSFGYLDPEYFRRQQLTEKSDVYSFGVVLFEALCARAALNPSLPREQVSLADWALQCQKRGVLADIIDPQLEGRIGRECMHKFAETAEMCLLDHGVDRPSMGNVLWNLEFALQLQESFESGKPISEEVADKAAAVGNGVGLAALSEMSEDTDGQSTVAVFSQLINPVGR
ncbi:receptor-like protein kinase [Musa troglodytarum]|uniref:Receptor-like protein kinase n=1 Tax=Musa troglodytarum TaxID=320322 RepID=A0A9E7EH80_9LILI|nr:receptor-like protein kinase [Musa troglodytarum]